MTTKASKRQAQRESKPVARDLLSDRDALRAAAPMRGMPADDWQREVWGLTDD